MTEKRQGLRPSSRAGFALLALIGLGGIALIWYCTQWGAGLLDDAFIYITSGQNLAAGRGLAWPGGDGQLRPLVYFPPLFSIVLAGFEWVGVNAVQAARLVNAAAFGGSLVFAGLLARRAARSWSFAWLAAALLLSSDVLLEVHSWAMSEALYIFLGLAGMFLLVLYHERGRTLWLAVSALTLGLAFLTRYIGFSLLLAGGIALLISPFPSPLFPLQVRLRRLLGFAGISVAPVALWVARNLLVIGSPTDRDAGIHLVTFNQLQKALNTLLIWFVPGRLVRGREFLVAGVLFLAVIAALWLARRFAAAASAATQHPAQTFTRRLLALQAFFHILTLWTSKSFFDPITPLNDRLFSPILPALVILIVSLLSDFWSSQKRWLQVIAVGIAIAFLGFYGLRAAGLAPRLHNIGLGLARKGWHNSDTLQAVRALPPVPLYTNSPAAIYLWTGRSAYPIDDTQQMRQSMQQDGAVLVLFNSISLDLFNTSLEALTQGLTPTQTFQDGTLYSLSP